MKIGVFDSGSGGLTTLATIQAALPAAEYCYIGDYKNCPYGDKTPAQLLEVTTPIVEKLRTWGAQLIVIACNTATTRCIKALRQRFPDIIFVGTEPAIKVAYDHHKNHPLLLATTSTAHSQQVQRLQSQFFPNGQLELLPCPGLANTIERGFHFPDHIILPPHTSFHLPDISTSHYEQIQIKLTELFAPIANKSSYDAIILGCTHYPIVATKIAAFFPNAEILDGNSGVARHVHALATSFPS